MTVDIAWVDEAWRRALAKTRRNVQRIGGRYPHASVGGEYVLEEPGWWTAGFWPGLLWLLYGGSGEEAFRRAAEQCEEGLDAVMRDYYRLDHDMGFMWTLTSVARYKLLGCEDSRRRALVAANMLAARFNVKGRFIRAWNSWREGDDNTGVAIIDCAMNVPLLFWASRETGDPRFRHVAEAHLDTVLAHFIDPDGAARHIVRFDPLTGERLEAIGGQGYSPESAWSRGAAWAVYGLALAARHTGREAYLDAARRVGSFFLENLPDDRVPPWDFRLPPGAPAVRDSSAGAIAACGLLLLADLTADERFRAGAVGMLEALYRRCGAWDLPGEEGLILHGTSHCPEGRNVDVPLIYGDYFFVEGLARLARGKADLLGMNRTKDQETNANPTGKRR